MSATTLILVRHGVTVHTSAKRFSGGLGGDDPPLSDQGREQIARTAGLLAGREIDAVLASPVRRTRESAEVLCAALGREPEVVWVPGFAEMEFGRWDGMSFAEVAATYPEEMSAWLASLDHPAGGAESIRDVETRVRAALADLLTAYAGRTVVLLSHVTPIKIALIEALGAPLEAVHRMELSPASVSEIAYYPDGRASMRCFNRVADPA